jgi:hypothetical protein
MKSWVIVRRNGQWGLYIRDYPCQGVNPDYILFKEITEAVALCLVEDRLANDIFGALAT